MTTLLLVIFLLFETSFSMTNPNRNRNRNPNPNPNPIQFNWAGNHQFSSSKIVAPKNVDELKKILKANNVGIKNQVKPLGARHSFSNVADTKGTLIQMTEMTEIIDLNEEEMYVKVEPGCTYAKLGIYLDKHGLALSNYASLPHITIGGAISTSTHGSGYHNQILASSVISFEMLLMDDETTLKKFVKDSSPHFYSALVSMGSVGILTSVTLKIEKQFFVRQCIYPGVEWNILLEDVKTFFQSAYSVSAFTDWGKNQDGTHDYLSSIFLKHKMKNNGVDKENQKDCPVIRNIHPRSFHPLPLLDPSGCSPNGVGKSNVMLPHFLPGNEPSGAGNELQTEYFIDFDQALNALHALRGISEQLAPFAQVSEFRVVAPDSFPMSVCYNKSAPCFGMHFTWINDVEGVKKKILPLVESTLSLFDPRPHLGKIHTIKPEIWRKRYPGYLEVLELAKKYDKMGRLKNDFLMKYLYGNDNDSTSTSSFDITSETLKDPRLAQIIKDFQQVAKEFDGMDEMDQILIDQVDDVLAEDEEDLSTMASINQQMESLIGGDLYGDFGDEL